MEKFALKSDLAWANTFIAMHFWYNVTVNFFLIKFKKLLIGLIYFWIKNKKITIFKLSKKKIDKICFFMRIWCGSICTYFMIIIILLFVYCSPYKYYRYQQFRIILHSIFILAVVSYLLYLVCTGLMAHAAYTLKSLYIMYITYARSNVILNRLSIVIHKHRPKLV